jgi:hypothetical protein
MAKRRKRPPPNHYRLVHGQPVLEPNLAAWDQWQAEHRDDLLLASTTWRAMQIDTFFHGIDDLPQLVPGPPKLYRTTVTGGKGNGMFRAYATRNAALSGHAQMVAVVQKYCGDDKPNAASPASR